MRDLLLLPALARQRDGVLLLLRLLTGSFLVTAMWPNVSDPETMAAVIGYFGDNGFAYPHFFGPLSAWAQLLIGLALIAGALTRWAGLLLAFNFAVGIVMVHWGESFRDCWPALALLGLGLAFAAFGGGRFSVDRLVGDRP